MYPPIKKSCKNICSITEVSTYRWIMVIFHVKTGRAFLKNYMLFVISALRMILPCTSKVAQQYKFKNTKKKTLHLEQIQSQYIHIVIETIMRVCVKNMTFDENQSKSLSVRSLRKPFSKHVI